MEEGKNKLADGVYLLKRGDDYKIIRPPKKDITKPFTKDNIHWGNLIGIKHNWLSLLIIVLLILSSIAYKIDTEECRKIVENPQKICGYHFQIQEVNITNIWDNTTFVEKQNG